MRISRATGAPERVAALNFQRENASVAASSMTTTRYRCKTDGNLGRL